MIVQPDRPCVHSVPGEPGRPPRRRIALDGPAARDWFSAYVDALADGHPRAAAVASGELLGLGLLVVVRHDASGEAAR